MALKRLEGILTQSPHAPSSKIEDHLSCTAWYSTKDGTICGIGSENPRPEKGYVSSVVLCCDERGLLPELSSDSHHVTKALERVLAQIRDYREQIHSEHYPPVVSAQEGER